MLKQFLKRYLQFPGLPETAPLRGHIEAARHPGWPYCPPDEGDLLYTLARRTPAGRALEVGCATGSTAIYMLAAMPEGSLTSIDFAHGDHGRSGEALIAAAGQSARHQLVEDNSIDVLPRLFAAGERFDLVFLDGWKTFDHVWVDTFYAAKMLKPGGYMVFDDARMPAVRKCISLLRSHYEFEDIDGYALIGGWRLRLWHALIARTTKPHYVALRKPREIGETPAGRTFDFWADF